MEQWKRYHDYWELGPEKYEIGDIVSRDGSDEQLVLDIDYDYMTIKVKCIKEPSVLSFADGSGKPWCNVGNVEDNLIRRYVLLRKGVN